jgi:hypothetical protein
LNIEGCIVLNRARFVIWDEQRPPAGLQCTFQPSNAHDPLVLPGNEARRAEAIT